MNVFSDSIMNFVIWQIFLAELMGMVIDTTIIAFYCYYCFSLYWISLNLL